MSDNNGAASNGSPRFFFNAENREKLMSQAVGTAERERVTIGGVTFPIYPLSFAQGLEIFKLARSIGELWSTFRGSGADSSTEKVLGEFLEQNGFAVARLTMLYLAYCCGLKLKYTVPTRDLPRDDVKRRLELGGLLSEMEIDDENGERFAEWFACLPLVETLVEIVPPLLKANGMERLLNPPTPAPSAAEAPAEPAAASPPLTSAE